MIKRFLKSMFATSEDATNDGGVDAEAAVAALLIEAGHSDGDFDAAEKEVILRVLEERLEVPNAEAAFAAGVALQRNAVDLFSFVRPLKTVYETSERVVLIEALWEVIYADGQRDRHEDSIVRRLLPLLGLTDQESGAARKRVVTRLGLDD